MMLTTHLLAGILLAVPVVLYAPEFAAPALIGAVLGSMIPDLDLYYGHRRTLHYPKFGLVATVITSVFALSTMYPFAIAAAFFAAGATLHARMDIYGGGLELRPWEGQSMRAVYDHYTDRWIPPRNLIRYDGAPEDVLLALGFAIPSLLVLDGAMSQAIIGLLIISILYAIVRKPIVDVGVFILQKLPRRWLVILPMRYLEESYDHT